MAWFILVYFGRGLKSFSVAKQILVITASVCLVGVIWEFLEYCSTSFSPNYLPWLFHYFSIGNLVDTLGDLLADTLGGLLVAVLATLSRGRR